MLRISERTEAGSRTLVVEGRLVGPWIEELRRAVAEGSARGPTSLDLAGLRFAEPEGVSLLRRLVRAEGLRVARASAYVDALLAPRSP